MPASLEFGSELEIDSDTTDPEQDADAESKRNHRSRYVARRMRMGLPMVRWLNVQSDEFKEIFSFDKKQRRRTHEASN